MSNHSQQYAVLIRDGQRLAVNRFMLGNFAPQPHEAFAPHLPITGTLPDELVGGVYARIGRPASRSPGEAES
jgi:carotenoid cleavage dioxygenase-like enzyme